MRRKIIFIAFLFLCFNVAFGQTFNNDTTLSGTYNGSGKIMFINAKITGPVTLTNCVIQANPFIQIFDTTVTLGANVNCERFSGMWFGAKPANADNSRQFQYAINACVNKPFPLYIPAGTYTTSQPLIVSSGTFPYWTQSQIKIYGDATFWDTGIGTTISYTGDSCALGFELNKGSEVSHLIIKGGWVSPGGTDSAYYNTTLANYNNQAAHGNGVGIWIDPVGNYAQRSGSTGCYFHDLFVQNFKILIEVSNPISQNGEIMLFDRIQCGNAQLGFYTNQPQEKSNRFTNIYSWGAIHTLFTINNGNYNINGGNVAGKCIRVFNISNQSWFPSCITNFYAENIGMVGNFSTYLPLNISNSNFDFIVPSKVGYLPLVTANNDLIKFDNTQFRYYGLGNNLVFNGGATYENCLFSGTVTGTTGSVFINYSGGAINNNGAQVYQTLQIDTIPQPPSVKLSLRSSQ